MSTSTIPESKDVANSAMLRMNKTMFPVPDEWPLEFPEKGEPVVSQEGGASASTNDDSVSLGGCRRIDDAYERLGNLGEGTYGDVFKARDRTNGDIVAVKRIKTDKEKEGFPITAIREIKILSMLASSTETLNGELLRENIIRLREVVRSDSAESNQGKGSVYMVFDYMEHDMAGLLDRANQERKAAGIPHRPPFPIGQVKRYMKQIFKGLALLDGNQILHRDLKNANLLVNNRGDVKIADFGLARKFFRKPITASAAFASPSNDDGVQKSPPPDQSSQRQQQQQPTAPMTNRVITLWYRPPELCLGCEQYGPEVDMWSAGCIMAELLSGMALFPGRDESDQVAKIAEVLGEPNDASLPGCSTFKDYNVIMSAVRSKGKIAPISQLRDRLRKMHITDPGAVRMLESLLSLNPLNRMTAARAASDPWFMDEPKMFEADQMPYYEPSHELAMKKRREAEREKRGAHPYPQYRKQSVPPPPTHHPQGWSNMAAGAPQYMQYGSSRDVPPPPPPGGPQPRIHATMHRGGRRGGRSSGGYGGRGYGPSNLPSWQQERR